MTPLIVAIVIAQTAGSPQSTGYPECDKFIQMVTECINTKMPQSARADRRQELDAFRGALSFIPASVASEKCTENIKLEMQRDRYGCYAAHAAKAGVQTPCSLVTPADLQQILTTAYGEGQPGASKCTYQPGDGAPRPVTIEVRWTGGREELEGARSVQKQMDQAMRTSARKSVVPGKTIPGLGDDAFLIVAGFMPMLYARKGDAAVSVTAPVSESQLTAIARKALERLPR
jgi:hypothetical protein